MFDFLKGGKAKLIVEPDRPTKPYLPGETIHVKVTVQGEKDLKIHQALISVAYCQEYQYGYESTSTDEDGNTETNTYTKWETDTQEILAQQFLGEMTIRAGSNQTFEFSAFIPPNAPPTLQGGKILRGTWLVKTTLDRKLASDIEDKRQVTVLRLLTEKTQPDTPGNKADEFTDAGLALSVPVTAFTPGETVTGELLVCPKKTFDVNEIRVELACQEFVPQDAGNTNILKTTVKVAGKTKLESGKELKYPFQVSIPASQPVTYHSRHGTVTWTVCGVLARAWHPDTTVNQDIYVYGARGA